MSFESSDEERLATLPNFNPEHQVLEKAPRGKQRLGWFTVMCLILNRSIGSTCPEIYKKESRKSNLLFYRHRHLRDPIEDHSGHRECRPFAHSLGFWWSGSHVRVVYVERTWSLGASENRPGEWRGKECPV